MTSFSALIMVLHSPSGAPYARKNTCSFAVSPSRRSEQMIRFSSRTVTWHSASTTPPATHAVPLTSFTQEVLHWEQLAMLTDIRERDGSSSSVSPTTCLRKPVLCRMFFWSRHFLLPQFSGLLSPICLRCPLRQMSTLQFIFPAHLSYAFESILRHLQHPLVHFHCSIHFVAEQCLDIFHQAFCVWSSS